MKNARKEISHLSYDDIEALNIIHDKCLWDDESNVTKVTLRKGFTQEEFNDAISKLDFNYDNGFGGQELFGTIWLTDGSWMTRGEYDGSEWWEHHVRPSIEEYFKNQNESS